MSREKPGLFVVEELKNCSAEGVPRGYIEMLNVLPPSMAMLLRSRCDDRRLAMVNPGMR